MSPDTTIESTTKPFAQSTTGVAGATGILAGLAIVINAVMDIMNGTAPDAVLLMSGFTQLTLGIVGVIGTFKRTKQIQGIV